MKKKFIFAAVAVIAAVSAGISIFDADANQASALELANIEALTRYESPYGCPDACMDWSGNDGGGIACDCGRYVGKCKRRCA